LGEPLTVAKLAGLALIGIGVTVLALAGPSATEPTVDAK
jgi:hypothetical protein